MRISKVISIVSFVLATGAVVASTQDKPADTTQAAAAPAVAPQAAPASAPQAKPAEVKPVGTFYGKIFADWNYDVTQNTTNTEKSLFELSRVYMGYNYKFNNNFTTDALLDVTRVDPVTTVTTTTTKVDTTGVVKLPATANQTIQKTTVVSGLSTGVYDGYMAYLKTAYVAWNGILPATTLVFGQLPYFAFDVQESFWGHRYIYKSFMDNQSWASSADLGAVVKVAPIDMLKLTGGITNGEGYKANQDKFGDYKVAGAVQLNPLKELTLYVYGDFMP
jgi:hypothetical protein